MVFEDELLVPLRDFVRFSNKFELRKDILCRNRGRNVGITGIETSGAATNTACRMPVL